MEKQDLVLKVENLSTSFKDGKGSVQIVKDVSFEVPRGKLLAIVGESGCGKSVTVHSIMQLLPKNGQITRGKALFYEDDKEVDLFSLDKFGKAMRGIRGAKIGMVFQDPMASLNPMHQVGKQVTESLLEHYPMSKKEAMEKVIELFKRLGIPDPEQRVKDYPHQFSGGMRQRVMIAISMICNPDLLIADEPTTALDVTIQAQIMDLMKELQEKYNKSIILITHNMGLVAEVADYVAVMYMGRIVEYGTVRDVLHNSSHPYTKSLLKSVPIMGLNKLEKLATIRGSTPNPKYYKGGCEFAERCDFATNRCRRETISNTKLSDSHDVRCLLFEDSEEVMAK
ncbi:ABC transporter ATP-binding protein [Neobacillus bataviensis LMG 21833]|uniref:ABC transporter ATP-binding protein n=1 Tax=Neobacillus bataviensis LMG 21833 TaxID=1117379 RepID=K6C5X1_9BACI|nr:ABC transporter ATP-binding protein [Neobacillus bataviensis]EKN66490.1 ABC transporter ATP-binding protein [Neobacillus bataviensis LMG 21833]